MVVIVDVDLLSVFSIASLDCESTQSLDCFELKHMCQRSEGGKMPYVFLLLVRKSSDVQRELFSLLGNVTIVLAVLATTDQTYKRLTQCGCARCS